jgi:hypothetical protein
VSELHSFYHVYADGDWPQAVTEHCHALTAGGLYDELTTFNVGFVGSDENVAAVRMTLDVLTPNYKVCVQSPYGWEQETLDQVYEFIQTNDGLVSYAHTKGAANPNTINENWRRSMEWHNFVNWQTPTHALENDGYTIAGCYWICGGESSVPGFGTGGMFGGNYWWARCDSLRQNVPPGHESRFAAEHWLGQLSEVMPIINGQTICCMSDGTIGMPDFGTGWLP